ncbi:glycosyltransferase [Flavobacteriaceae bacterium]|nr:glycosyltransferase [Flavobacteriaceae bacterium]
MPTQNTPVSVVICAKNEAKNIQEFLPSILAQEYANFEIVLINDRSYDETANLFEAFAEKHANIKIVTIRESEHFYGNKKYALTLGIKAATNDCLLFTDADCKPVSKHWITEMVGQYNNSSKEIVLGYGGYTTIKNSFLNKLIRYETLQTAIQYFSYAKLGIPYMGVGRNLCYSKALFLRNKGFNKYVKILSGDDDLFINQVATKTNSTSCYTTNAHTISTPKTTWAGWIYQKRRHISTADYYQKKHQFLLGLFATNRLLFWVLLPLLPFLNYTSQELYIVLGLLASKFLTEWLVVGLAAKKLNEHKIALLAPLLDFILLIAQLYIYKANLYSKPKTWS